MTNNDPESIMPQERQEARDAQQSTNAFGVQATEGGGFVIDKPEGIQLYRLLTIKTGLRMECRTGMKLSSRAPSMLATANKVMLDAGFITKAFARREPCLAKLEEYIAHYTTEVEKANG